MSRLRFMPPRLILVAASMLMATTAHVEATPPSRILQRDDYADRLRAMWLAECIANWTGLQTEGARTAAPFYTDADWGASPDGRLIDFITSQDPWAADDDTDIEYVYLHLVATYQRPSLTPLEIKAGWQAHINRFIWVSNQSARALIDRGVRPPATSLGMANPNRLQIDAQLTTEVFGALSPGMVDIALQTSELPIRTTAHGFAAHAAQFHVALYSLASQVDPALSPRDQVIWLVQQARQYIPSTSKSADVIDFVLADFIANPDPDNWEYTRDRVYLRYHLNAAANGFTYRSWYESSINLATSVMALLYGQGDLKRTIQIGTLSGWDSDNGTATMAGLLGLMHGTQWVRDQFPGTPLSDRFWILRTRDNLPDYLPNDTAAEDTFTLMAARAIPVIEQAITDAGGGIEPVHGTWVIPPIPITPPGSPPARTAFNPLTWHDSRSANNSVRRAGGAVTANATWGNPPWPRGSGWPDLFASGVPTDFSGVDRADADQSYYSSEGVTTPGQPVAIEVTYDRVVEVHTVRFIEGDQFTGQPGEPAGVTGGWIDAPVFQVRIGANWVSPAGVLSEPFDAARPFQIIDFALASPANATGVRVVGSAGGATGFATCSQLDALSSPPTAAQVPRGTFDLSADGAASIDDLYRFAESPRDLDGDGVTSMHDRRLIESRLRLSEVVSDLGARQRPSQ